MNKVLTIYNNSINESIQHNGLSKVCLDQFIHWIPDSLIRVSIFDTLGKPLYDSEFELSRIEQSHADRPEFITAQEKGYGSSMRYSETAKIKYYYYIQRFGSLYVRTALPFDVEISTMLSTFNKDFLLYVLILLLGFVLCVWMMSRVLNRVFIQLKNIAQKVEHSDQFLDKKLFLGGELQEVGNYIEKTYSELKLVKEELEFEKNKLFKHLQIAQEGLAIFSPDRQCIVFNELFLQYLNLMSDHIEKKPEKILDMEEFSAINEFISEQNSAIKATTLKITTVTNIFSVKCIVFEDKSFEISINEISQAEQQSILKKQLTENIAHELRTPVSSISGYLETIIENPDLPEERLRLFLARSYAQSVRLSHLVNDILLLNRMDSESDFFFKEPLDLSELIRNVSEDTHLQLVEKDMQIEVSPDRNMQIQGNRSLLYSVFRNLIDNSVNYAGEHTHIKIQMYKEDVSNYYFSYSDNGVGVPSGQLNRIFDRFYRIDKGRSRKVGGTGLGLSIVKNAVLIHNGNIFAKNLNTGGLEFLFTLGKI